jgi:hypothetical protein
MPKKAEPLIGMSDIECVEFIVYKEADAALENKIDRKPLIMADDLWGKCERGILTSGAGGDVKECEGSWCSVL